MDTYIIDASVGAKWCFKEDLWEQADELRQSLLRNKARLVVPQLFYPEVANACRKRVRRKFATVRQAIDAFDSILHLPLHRYVYEELAEVALEHALRLGISVYDGIYLALAEIYVSPLVTADETLYQACKGKFDFIEFLGGVNLSKWGSK